MRHQIIANTTQHKAREALKAAGPAAAPQMMAVTAEAEELDALAAVLAEGTETLSEDVRKPIQHNC